MDPEPIRITRFRPSSMQRILEIEAVSFPDEPYPKHLFREYYENCPKLFLVARRRREIAGYSITCADARRAELISIAVAPEHRRAGVAQALLNLTTRSLKLSGVADLDLMVRVTSEPAIAFYARNGFKKMGTVRNYYGQGAAGIRMRKTLI